MAKRDITRPENVELSGKSFPVVEFKGVPVVTLAMIDEMHERAGGTAARNFKQNRTRFEEGKHFYHVDSSKKDEFRLFGISVPPRGFTVLTERGYLLLAKSLTDEKAWDVQERLIDCYFRAKGNLQEHNPLALEDMTKKHYWLTMNESGKVLAQVELKDASCVSEKVDEVFPESVVLNRAPVIEDMDEIMGMMYEMTTKVSSRMNRLIPVLGTPTNATQEDVDKFWKSRVRRASENLSRVADRMERAA